MEDLTGQIISHYRILDLIGRGGMGVVYRARDLALDRSVALKFLPPDLTSDIDARERFIQEAKSASALDHPHVCTIYELGMTAEEQVFIAMACYDGETLRKKMQRGPLEVDEALQLASQVASGLAAAHKGGIVHRDIKPANILVTSDGTAKIIDFGLAKLAGQARLTRAGTVVGTVAYMSPEQARGEDLDARTDLWSLGTLLYEMLAGKTPFAAEHEQAVIYRILNERPEPLARSREGIPPSIQIILDRALQKDPVERYPSALEFLYDLNAAHTGEEPIPSAPSALASIAVLPFQDMSPEHDQEYFCDGVAEELINALTHVSGLRVIARTSSFSFKGTKTDVAEIGKRLGVATLLEGSVRKAGRRLRIAAQLTRAKDGSSIWSQRYDRDLEDIFAIQDEVCASIVEQLKMTLGRGERSTLERRRARNHEAYNLYLKGRFLFYQRKRDSVAKSIEYYSRAVALDPAFALAFAGLAESYEVLGSWQEIPMEVAFGEARKASDAALRLDDRLPEAHVTAGYVELFCNWNWAAAEREFQRALTLNPSCAEAHHMRAHYLELMGKFDLALSEMKHAIELEPVAPALSSCTAQVLYHARRYDEAIRQAYATLEMAPTFHGLQGWVGAAYLLSGLPDSAVAALNEGLRHIPDDLRLQALFGYASAVSGDSGAACAVLDKLQEYSGRKYVDPYYLIWLHEALGDRAGATASLVRAIDEHSGWLPWVCVDPLLEGLCREPRVEGLLEKLGLRPRRGSGI